LALKAQSLRANKFCVPKVCSALMRFYLVKPTSARGSHAAIDRVIEKQQTRPQVVTGDGQKGKVF
jgi:hypothetical protein